MKTQKWLRSGAVGFSIAIVSWAIAWETDQFNPLPESIPDLGAEVSEHVLNEIESAIRAVNERIDHHETCLRLPAHDPKCATRIAQNRGAPTYLPQPHAKRIQELRSESGLLEAIYDRLGNGFPTPKIEKYFASHTFKQMPALYKAPFAQSLYSRDMVNYLSMAPTVRMYGVELGTDKVAHLFQQGYDFHLKYREEIARGLSELDAQATPIEWSKSLERGFFGTAIVGIYANADLAANYAGFWFYRNILNEIQLGTKSLPPLVKLVEGHWELVGPADRTKLLAPFITDHLNEALNPSSYNFSQQAPIRKTLEGKLCQSWLKSLDTPRGREQLARADAGELATWYGRDYGFTPIEPDSRFILECRPNRSPSSVAMANYDVLPERRSIYRKITLPASLPKTELILTLKIDADCTLPARIHFRGRTHRLDLFHSTGRASTLLGTIPSDTPATLVLGPPECPVRESSLQIDFTHAQQTATLANAPCVNVRDDQYDNFYTDRARLLMPSLEKLTTDPQQNPFGDQILKYTMFFTDEDSKNSPDAVNGQRARYGRSTDIEVVSFRRVSRDGDPMIYPSYFQSGLSFDPQRRNFIMKPSDCSAFSDPGHGCREFRGKYLEGTTHPIVYNSASNNVFSDEPSAIQRRRGLELYCIPPTLMVPAPAARELVMFVEPHLFRDSDEEMEREGKQPARATEYLYLRVRGSIPQSLVNRGYAPSLTLSNGTTRVNTSFYATIDRLGEDLYGKETFSAVPMSGTELNQLMSGEISARLEFEKTWGANDLQVDSLRFYRIYPSGKSYRTQEITHLIRKSCDLKGAATRCQLEAKK